MATLRHLTLARYDGTCAICGVKNDVIPLDVAHIIPLAMGGESSEENLIAVCPNCNQAFSRQPREIEFVGFLRELLSRHSDFTKVEQEVVLGRDFRFRADLVVDRRRRDVSETLLIECKSYLARIPDRIQRVIKQLQKYKAGAGECRMVLAVPATLSHADLAALTLAGIETWDLRYIASNFSEQIKDASPSYYKSLLLAQIARPQNLSREQKLLDSLKTCKPGRADCYVYQSLVGEILECLFTPPLGKPIAELPDKSATNRRDFIMPNYAENGFWSFLRQRYKADYIVIDAKNYTRRVKKNEVLQVANYLKAHGAGLCGLIISRNGGDASGCEHTLREQWLVHRKLIIVLDDEDIKAMLTARLDGRPAEEILGQRIEQFRLSM